MAIGNVECHLARAQLKRLGQGEQLPAEIDADLEQHLRICEECRLEAVRLRQVLMGDAAPAEPKAKVNPSELLLQVGEIVRNLISRLPLPGAKRLAPSKSNGWMNDPGTPFVKDSRVNMRVAFTSIGLALTLIAMSTILRDPTALLGAKAGTKATVSKETTKEDEKESTEETITDEHAKDEHAEDEATKDEHADEAHAEDEHAADLHGDIPTEDAHGDKTEDEHAPAGDPHAAAPKSNSNSSTHAPRQQNGLSLPGQPTMEDAPILKARDGQVVQAQRSTPAPTRTQSSTTNSQRRSRPSTSATRRPAPTRPAPSRPAPRPATTPRPQSNSGTSQNKVTVYLPNGEKKN